MISRVTSQTMMQTAERNLQANLVRLAELQDKASSQRAFTRPSDDPAATADSLRIRAELRAAQQYGNNIDNGNGWLTTLDSALSATTDLMNRAREITLSGANGSLSPAARQAFAVELESLREDLFNTANTRYQGRTVFAGNSDAGAAFAPDLSFNGGSPVERRIGPDVTVRVDADGAAVFGTGEGSVFRLLDNIAADLRSGGDTSASLGELETRLDAVLTQHTEVGVRHGRILAAQEANMEQSAALEVQRSGVEDVDLAQVILDMKLQEVAYQSALAVTARALQPTLMDFLR